MMQNNNSLTKNNNCKQITIFVIVIILCIFGTVFIYSASNYTANVDYNDKFYFVKKQLLGYALGLIFFYICSKINSLYLKKYASIIFVISLILLFLVLTPLGKEVYGAKRWIGIGGFTFQPSEFSKFAFVIFVSTYLSKDMTKVCNFKGCIPILLAGGVTCLLIMLEPNMSVTICIGIVMIAMLFVSGTPVKHVFYIILPIIILLPLLIIVEPYRLKRLSAFLDPWSSPKGEGYQLLQSLYALGSGGFFGVGIFNSRQKLKFLPFSESDFILSIIGEEIGMLGIIALLAFCFVLAYVIVKIAIESNNIFDYLFCIGVSCVFLVQVCVNVLVVTGSIPPTGIPFPLVSSGNTQIIVFMSAFGFVSGISRCNNKCKL